MAQGVIFPVTLHGQLSDVYGTNIAAYANSQGFPQGTGLVQGQFGVLFDRTIVRLLKAAGGVNPFDAVFAQTGNGNDYTVLQSSAVGQKVVGFNDRSGSTPLVAGNIAWFTEQGLATANVLGGITAGVLPLVSSGTAGFLGSYSPGSANVATGVITGFSIQTNIDLLNSSTVQGSYPVRIG